MIKTINLTTISAHKKTQGLSFTDVTTAVSLIVLLSLGVFYSYVYFANHNHQAQISKISKKAQAEFERHHKKHNTFPRELKNLPDSRYVRNITTDNNKIIVTVDNIHQRVNGHQLVFSATKDDAGEIVWLCEASIEELHHYVPDLCQKASQ